MNKGKTKPKSKLVAIKEKPKSCSWVLVVWGHPKYLIGAIAAAHSLRMVKTKHKITLIYAEMKIDEKKLYPLFDDVVHTDLWRFKVKPLRTKKQRELYGGIFSETANTKWKCLMLYKYEKVMFLDSDIVVVKNCDDLFRLNAPAATFSNPFATPFVPGGIPNVYGELAHGAKVPHSVILKGLVQGSFACMGSMVLLKPEKGLDQQHQAWMKKREPYGNPASFSAIDEQAICEFMSTTWTHIDPIYQFIPWKKNWIPRIKDPLHSAYALHYYHDKPWTVGEGQGWEDTKIWWKIYHDFEKKHKALAAVLKSHLAPSAL